MLSQTKQVGETTVGPCWVQGYGFWFIYVFIWKVLLLQRAQEYLTTAGVIMVRENRGGMLGLGYLDYPV